MRHSTGGTSASAKKSQNKALSSAEKNSAKKLVQARLPFKVIAPGSSPIDAGSTSSGENESKLEGNLTKTTDARKRKLSYESDDVDINAKEEANNTSKENVEVLVTASKKKKTAPTNAVAEEIVSLLDDDEADSSTNDDIANTSTASTSNKKPNNKKTPKTALTKEKTKGAGTPKSATLKGQKEKANSASKLTIKLPLSAGKKSKRRKSKVHTFLANNSTNDLSQGNNSCADSSDDIEEVSSELNPQKRTKLDFEEKENDAKAATKKASTVEAESEKSEKDKVNAEKRNPFTKKSETESINKTEETDQNKKPLKAESTPRTTRSQESKKNEKIAPSSADKCIQQDKEEVMEQNESILIASDSSDDEEADEDADDETENISIKQANVSSEINDMDSTINPNTTIESLKTSETGKDKALTPKQKKLMEQRHMARQEKERKLLEERKKKQQEKEEKELEKKREREEKEDQKRKEREEKEDQKRKEREEKEEVKRKEREEKERKRLAEIEAKNEEKRKRNEAKEEELRKKEDERKRKELEKEELELKKKKAAQAFTKFFVAKGPSNAQQNIEDDENTGDGIKSLAFRPFQIKGDMKLAPLCRKILTPEAKSKLESLIGCRHHSKDDGNGMDVDSDEEDIVKRKPMPKSKLYIQELKSGQIMPGKWRRPSTESKDDVVIVEDELERVGQEIVEDTPAYVREEMRVKFYKFHDNRRPPYYGTFRKKSTVVSGRKPFGQDKKFFDYEVDSDDEWEEEEPGESLEDGSDDDKEKESEDEDYEVDNEWFVPHGHLSDEELQNEDEFGLGDDNTREAQKAKLHIIQQEFAQEMKKKTEKIKPRLIGCIWADKNGNQPQECPKIIWETLGKRSMLYTDPPTIEEPKVEEPTSPPGPVLENKLKPLVMSDAMVKDLVRLVHGNNNSKNFLIKEYMAYVEKTEESIKNGESCNVAKAAVREKIDTFAEWQAVAANSGSAQSKDSLNKKKKIKKRLCWVVNSEVLDKMDMSSLQLQNTWEYTLNPKRGAKPEEAAEPINESQSKPNDKVEEKTKTGTGQITKFTKVLTDEEKAQNLQNTSIIHTPEQDCKEKKTGTGQITKFTKVLTDEEKAKNLQNTSVIHTPEQDSKEKKSKTENKVKSPVASSQPTKEKKRVPLLMSVARGQQIPTPAKNKLISQFLQKGSTDSKCSTASPKAANENCSSSYVISDDDDVVILD